MARSCVRALLVSALVSGAWHVTAASAAAQQPQRPASPAPTKPAPSAPPAANPVSPIGGFDDASIPAKWEARLRLGVALDGTIDQFGGIAGTDGSTRVPLGARFSFDSLNAARLAVVSRTQRLLSDSVGTSVGLTLGTVHTDTRTLVTRIPLQLDVGVARRFAIGLMVPLLRTRQSLNLRVNPGGTDGNLGFNPANATASGTVNTAAVQQNGQVQTQIAAAVRFLDSLLTTCPTTGTTISPACAAVNANRSGATQLVKQARTVATGIGKVYGTGTTPGTLLVPIVGTDAQRAVEDRLKALGTQFVAFQDTALKNPARPAGAVTRIGNAGFQQIITDPEFGIASDSARGVERAGIGDVELAGTVLWLDTFGVGNAKRLVRARSSATLGYRLATGAVDLAFEPFDVALGTGSPALLVRSATDVALGRRLLTTAIVRIESPFAKSQIMRIPVNAGDAYVPVDREQLVGRKLGRQVALELSPRWLPNDAFAVAAHWAYRTKQADEYTGTFTTTDTTGGAKPVSYDASVLGTGTAGHAQVLGFGITYSTLPAYAHGHAWIPIEVSYLHTSTASGGGGVVPGVHSDQLVMRLYFQLRGRNARRGR